MLDEALILIKIVLKVKFKQHATQPEFMTRHCFPSGWIFEMAGFILNIDFAIYQLLKPRKKKGWPLNVSSFICKMGTKIEISLK